MDISLTARLSLVPIEIRKDNKNYIVEDKSSGEFFEMPSVCIDAIHFFNDGFSLGEAESKLKGLYPEEEINIIDFASQLLELELIKEVNGTAIPKIEIKKRNEDFLWIPETIGKIFFNKYTYVTYIILFILNITMLITHPHLFPHYKDLFVFQYMALNIPTWLITGVILILLHELGHILAMRSYDLPTKLGIGNRLVLVVFETDMSPAWRLPTRDRNVLYLAGLSFDITILFGSLLAQILLLDRGEVILGICQVIVFNIFIRIVYQCCIYMKTDLYFVFENMSGCYNLMENAWIMIKKWLPFQKGVESEMVFEGERKTVVLYSVFFSLGVLITMSLYVFYYMPQLFYAVKSTLPGFRAPATSLPFLDAMLFVLQILISFGLLFYSWSKKLRSNR